MLPALGARGSVRPLRKNPQVPIEHDGILRLVSQGDPAGMSLREIVREAGVPPVDESRIRRLLRELVRDGQLASLPRGLYAPAQRTDVTGRLTLHPDGYGFVRSDEGGPDVFIPPRGRGIARHGDTVRVQLEPERGDGRRSGRVVGVIDAKGSRVTGILRRGDETAFLVPLDRNAGPPVPVAGDPGTTGDGTVVIGELSGGRMDEGPSRATIVRALGRPGEPGVDEAVVMEKFDLPAEYPAGAVRDAKRQAEAALARLAREAREDFRDWTTVTIDGETAKDFDDAVAIHDLGGGRLRLAVHIADVASFVPEGSDVDAEALERATSVYFPGRVLPMLPPQLSDDLCSLVPGRDRAVQSVIMDFDKTGRRTATRFADGWIRSAARLTYTEVGGFLEGQTMPALEPLTRELTAMGRLARLLRRKRMRRGSLDFDLPEPEVLLDLDGVTTGVAAGERNEAHRLVEEFMLAANEAVAHSLDDAGRAALYRIHEPPEAVKVEGLREAVEGFGYDLPPLEGEVEPSDLAAIIEKSRGRGEERFVHTLVLRSLMQARYSELPGEHFGLAAERYTHFTSPIRRYPDLIVHRILRAHRRGAAPDANDTEALRRLGEVARHCSRRERDAEAAEREILERKILAWLEGRVGERRSGYVTGVASFGLFVQLADVFADGIVPVMALPPGLWRVDDRSHRLVGSRPGQVYRLGDRLDVDIVRVDRIFRRVEFTVAGSPGGGRAAADRAGGRARAVSAGDSPAALRAGSEGAGRKKHRRAEGQRKSGSGAARPSGRHTARDAAGAGGGERAHRQRGDRTAGGTGGRAEGTRGRGGQAGARGGARKGGRRGSR